jgi:hypothetical protein
MGNWRVSGDDGDFGVIGETGVLGTGTSGTTALFTMEKAMIREGPLQQRP